MATTDNYTDSFGVQTTYTFNEAIEYIKRRNLSPTTRTISWRDSKTGEPVIIGCTGG